MSSDKNSLQLSREQQRRTRYELLSVEELIAKREDRLRDLLIISELLAKLGHDSETKVEEKERKGCQYVATSRSGERVMCGKGRRCFKLLDGVPYCTTHYTLLLKRKSK